jgi:hypothetical protein
MRMSLWDRWSKRLPGEKDQAQLLVQVSPDKIARVVTEGQINVLDRDVKDILDFVKSAYTAKDEKRSQRVEQALATKLEALKGKAVNLQASTNLRAEAINLLVDARRQEDWADLKEKIRFIIFRLATGIGLAAILLATYRVAAPDMLDIHLPMRLPYSGQ